MMSPNLYETLSGPSARDVVSIMRVWTPFAAIIVILMICIRLPERPQRKKDIAIVLGLIAFAWLLPPLVYFGIYFCAFMAPPTLAASSSWSRILIVHALSCRLQRFTVLTLFFAGLALIAFGRAAVNQSTVQVVFIGLAALTVPPLWC